MSGHASAVGQETSGLSPIPLLRLDPELGAAIPVDEQVHAERLLVVPGFTAAPGELEVPGDADEPSLGLLVLDGLVTVNIVLGDRIASQLAGPGDVLDVCATPDALLPADVRHFVSETAHFAVLDRRFIAAVRRWPALLLTLHERLRSQERRLAVHAAIGKLRRVEDRVLAVLWHLGERWGRMTTEGVVVPLALTHETIGRLAGAERPTVSLALGELASTGAVVRREDGAFVLRHGSTEQLAGHRSSAPQTRPLAAVRTPEPAPGPAASDAPEESFAIDRAALSRRIAALHDDLPGRARSVHEILVEARRTSARSREVRERLNARRIRERAG